MIASDETVPVGLSLDNDSDSIRLIDDDDELVAIFAYGEGTSREAITDESATRDPDLTGDFTRHSVAADDEESLFSPGTRVDGSSF